METTTTFMTATEAFAKAEADSDLYARPVGEKEYAYNFRESNAKTPMSKKVKVKKMRKVYRDNDWNTHAGVGVGVGDLSKEWEVVNKEQL